MESFRGKRVLVTGAGVRVGAAIATHLGGLGARVGVHYRSSSAGAQATAERIRQTGGEAVLLSADLMDRQAARDLVDQTQLALGGLDLLVVSAANFERVSFDEIDPGHWDRAVALNLTAAFELAHRAAVPLRDSRGSIVFITCVSRLSPYLDYLPYQVAKAGLHQLMRVMALELAPHVRVNAVAPGTVLPPDDMKPGDVAALLAQIPLGRVGSARDIAEAVAHLASNSAITGQEIVVDGGHTA